MFKRNGLDTTRGAHLGEEHVNLGTSGCAEVPYQGCPFPHTQGPRVQEKSFNKVLGTRLEGTFVPRHVEKPCSVPVAHEEKSM